MSLITTPLITQSTPQAWKLQCIKRIKKLWLIKAAGTSLFMAIFFYSYFQVLHQPIYPVVTMPLTIVDEWIVFWPPAFYVYASLWFYAVLMPALQPSFYRLVAYGCGIGLVCLTGLVFFLFFPTTVPYAAMEWFNDPELSLLRRLDLAGNACPSLHVAAALFTALCLHSTLRRIGCPTWLLALSWVWCALIVYSTMAIKQHVMWDVVAGALLALPMAALYLRFESTLTEN
jgi:membrane-associated phospholipid phosphatase